jgi:hypothetical protein
VIKYVYEIDYPPGGKDKYLGWVRSIADALQAPAELRGVASYDNVYSATPHRVVEFTFDSPEDADRYFDRKEIGLIVPTSVSRSWRCVTITAGTPWLVRPLRRRISPEFLFVRLVARLPGPDRQSGLA